MHVAYSLETFPFMGYHLTKISGNGLKISLRESTFKIWNAQILTSGMIAVSVRYGPAIYGRFRSSGSFCFGIQWRSFWFKKNIHTFNLKVNWNLSIWIYLSKWKLFSSEMFLCMEVWGEQSNLTHIYFIHREDYFLRKRHVESSQYNPSKLIYFRWYCKIVRSESPSQISVKIHQLTWVAMSSSSMSFVFNFSPYKTCICIMYK